MSTHKLRLFCAASVAAIAAAGPANAQSVTVSRDKMDALEAQINALQQELRDLKGKVGKAEAAAQKANAAASANAAALAASPSPPPPPTGAVAKMSPGYQPSICAVEAYDGERTMPVKAGIAAITDQNCIAFTSRLHLDVGGYNYHPDIAINQHFVPNSGFFTIPQNLDSGVNARRARIGVLGTFQSDWKYSLIYDMGGSSDGFTSSTIGCALSGSNTPSGVKCKIGLLPGGITSGIEAAYLSYQGIKGGYSETMYTKAGPVTTTHTTWNTAFEGGYSDTFYTLEEATSSNDIMFLERASSQVIASNIAAGDFRSNAGGRLWGDWPTSSGNGGYWVGAYVTGPTSGAMHSATSGGILSNAGTTPVATVAATPPDGTTEQLGGFARGVVHFGDPKQYSIHLGGDYEELFKPPYDYDTGAQVLSLADRPELRIDPTTIVGTGIQGVGNNTIANVSRAIVYSVEAAGNIGPFFAQGEYFWYDVDRRNFAQGGGSGQFGPTLHFNGGYAEASWTLTGETHGYNAATAAYTSPVPSQPFSWKGGTWGAFEIAGRYSVIDLNDRLGFADGASGGKQTIVTAGLNWYVNRNIRFMLDYMHGTIDKPAGPLPLAAGQTCGTAIASTGLTGLQCNVGAKFDAVAMRTQIAF